jgi:hypothetical protein
MDVVSAEACVGHVVAVVAMYRFKQKSDNEHTKYLKMPSTAETSSEINKYISTELTTVVL